MNNELLAQADPEISAAINDELTRQRNTLELIASENIPSLPVIETMGTILTNKYAEGYPGKRYYGGCASVDTIETIARNRACWCSGQSTPTCSHIRASALTPPLTSRCSIRVPSFWACRSRLAAISRTVPSSRSRVVSTMPIPMA